MKEYILVPAGEYKTSTKQTRSNDILTPIQVTSEIGVPEHSRMHTIARFNAKSANILHKDISPEVNLKVFNYLQNIYRSIIQGTSGSSKNSSSMNNIEQDLGYSIKSYVKTLPLKKRELGVSLVDHLVKANIAEMDNHGYLRIHNMTKKVHVTDFLRAFLINNSKIETDLAGFYKQIASNLPKTFIKNKKLLSGTLIDGDGTYWDTLTT